MPVGASGEPVLEVLVLVLLLVMLLVVVLLVMFESMVARSFEAGDEPVGERGVGGGMDVGEFEGECGSLRARTDME